MSGFNRSTIHSDPRELSTITETSPESDEAPLNQGDLRRRYWRYSESQGRRIAPRYTVEFEVLVANPLKYFRSKSANISASGILLREALPVEFMAKIFDVVIIRKNSGGKADYLSFRAKAVGGPNSTSRLTFVGFRRQAQEELSNLLSQFQPMAGSYIPNS